VIDRRLSMILGIKFSFLTASGLVTPVPTPLAVFLLSPKDIYTHLKLHDIILVLMDHSIENKPRAPKWFLTIAIIIVIAGVIAYKNKSNFSPPQTPVVTLRESIEPIILSKYGKISFPAITNLKNISTSSIPTNLKDLILKDSSNVQLKGLTYAGGKKGFILSYIMHKSELSKVNGRLSRASIQEDKKLLNAVTAENFAFIDYQEGSLSQARIKLNPGDRSRVFVTIQTIDLK